MVSIARDQYIKTNLQPGEHHQNYITAANKMLAFLENIKREAEVDD